MKNQWGVPIGFVSYESRNSGLVSETQLLSQDIYKEDGVMHRGVWWCRATYIHQAELYTSNTDALGKNSSQNYCCPIIFLMNCN